MMINEYKVGSYYISSDLTIGLYNGTKEYNNHLIFLEKNNKIKIFASKANANTMYKLKLEHRNESSARSYANNQSITELFDLIVHHNSRLSSGNENALHSPVGTNAVHMDFTLDRYTIQNNLKNEFIIENLRFELVYNLSKKLLLLSNALGYEN